MTECPYTFNIYYKNKLILFYVYFYNINTILWLITNTPLD